MRPADGASGRSASNGDGFSFCSLAVKESKSQSNHRPGLFFCFGSKGKRADETRLDAKLLPPVDPTRSVDNRWLGRQLQDEVLRRTTTRCNKGAKQGLEEWPAGLLCLAGGPIKRRSVGTLAAWFSWQVGPGMGRQTVKKERLSSTHPSSVKEVGLAIVSRSRKMAVARQAGRERVSELGCFRRSTVL